MEVNRLAQEAVYRGNIVKCHVRLCAALPVMLTVAVAYRASTPRFQVGEKVRIGWDARDGRLLSDAAKRSSQDVVENHEAGSASLRVTSAADRMLILSS
ncbi:TOBE domain-containing protein [Mesorhizobium sp. M6A.T.Cr.TU.014.01.1.1]|nr:TOBE domain-containing protein [Mesorhizobium sp. M6A.T.Cr.TU.014.01.1.1]RWP94987.1 MAG: TOBE domain-containing protein [Mesorhizobium sp.]RWP95280.1 MAG: TOBE domain-containing protein [Mesorhizobium sp.]